MKSKLTLLILIISNISYAQSLPIDFESDITTANFEDFSGGEAMVIDNPQSNGINTSSKVAQLVRDGGEIREGDKLSENWIFIDLLHFWNQQGVDILDRIKKTPRT